MSDPLTSTLRLTKTTVGGDSGTWGTLRNANMDYIDEAINGIVSVNIGGLTTYTMTADGSSADQARYKVYNFTGALTGDCTVTLPSSTKVGWVVNATTGSHNVILTTGSGDTITVSSGGLWTLFTCDGTNVDFIPLDLGSTLTVTGAVTLNNVLTLTSGSTGSLATISQTSGSNVNANLVLARQGTAGSFATFTYQGGTVGTITTNGTTTSYNTTSDRRLKIPAGLITDSARIIDGLKPRLFLWKNRVSDEPEAGFFAQEAVRVSPQAVRRGRGKPGTLGFEPWAMDNSKIVPVLVAEMQALRKRVAELERKLLKAGRG